MKKFFSLGVGAPMAILSCCGGMGGVGGMRGLGNVDVRGLGVATGVWGAVTIGTLMKGGFPPLLPVRCFSEDAKSTPRAKKEPSIGSLLKDSVRRAPSSKKENRVMSLEEALYLSREAGLSTLKENQKIIMTSPSFSTGKSPFLLENFFDSRELEEDEEAERRILQDIANDSSAFISGISDDEDDATFNQKEQFLANEKEEISKEEAEKEAEKDAEEDAEEEHDVPYAIHQAFVRNFNPSWSKTFTHRGSEWLVQSEGRGTAKRSVAHVVIRKGSGQVKINGDEDIYARWPYYYNRMDVLQPFLLTRTAGVYDLFISTKGGGVSGQAKACRLAVGRALVNACPSCQDDLEEDMVLYEDKRQKMPKMPGRVRARKMKSWSKR